jgi:hypothetical protein
LLSFLQAQEGHEVQVQVCVGKQEPLAGRLIALGVCKQEAGRRRERENLQMTHRPEGCQALLPGKRKPKQQRRGKPKDKKVSPARLPLADWTIVLTTVAQDLLSVQQVLLVVRC